MLKQKKISFSPGVRKSLTKLLIALAVLAGSILECVYQRGGDFVGVLIVFTILVMFPTVILLSIDAGRAISRDGLDNKSMRVFGMILMTPQIFLGVALVLIGIAYPFIGIREIVTDISRGHSPIFPFISTAISFMMIVLGYFYLRKSFNLGKKKNGARNDNEY